MITRPTGGGWQTILADLSLILFMVTAAALADAPDRPPDSDRPPGSDGAHAAHTAPARARPAQRATIAPVAEAEAVGVWRAGVGAPALPRWLHEVGADPRLRLTITVHYRTGQRRAALAQAAQLAEAAGARGGDARIVVEPGEPGASAALGYDAAVGSAANAVANSVANAVFGT